MPYRGNRRTGAASRLGRALGFITLALIFAGSAFLLTCQKKPLSLHGHHSRPSERVMAAETNKTEESEREPSAAEPAPSASNYGEPTAHPSHDPRKMSETQRSLTPGTSRGPSVMSQIKFAEAARGNTKSKKIALTFDAGADSSPTGEILDALAKHHVHATFFLTGRWITKNPDLVRRIAADGHEIGNHTYSHKRLTGLDAAQIADEVEKTDRLVVELTGKSTKPLLRVPYGSRDDRVLQELKNLGYRSVYWDVDCWDSVRPDYTPADIEKRVLGLMENGSIVLMHCGSKASASALDALLEKLSAEGYQQVTVSELLGL